MEFPLSELGKAQEAKRGKFYFFLLETFIEEEKASSWEWWGGESLFFLLPSLVLHANWLLTESAPFSLAPFFFPPAFLIHYQ